VFYVYVLLSLQDRALYIGFSTDLKGRLADHICGVSSPTKHRGPWKLIYYEAYAFKGRCVSHERQFCWRIVDGYQPFFSRFI